MSGEHLKIRQDSHGIISVQDLDSTNGTEVILGAEVEPFTEKDLAEDIAKLKKERALGRTTLGSEVFVENSNIVSSVPSDEELQELKLAKSESQDMKKAEELKQIESEFDEFKSHFTDEDRINMWRYSAGILNKAEAQKKRDGQGSIVEGQNASEGFNNLKTPELKQAANTYLSYMRRLNSSRNS